MNNATINDGVYFGMPDETYHSIPALSASGLKHLLISPMDFWARSWMAPKELKDAEDSMAKTIGKAYHKRILEGKEAFYNNYAHSFSSPDGCLKTNDDLKEALAKLDIKAKGKKEDYIKVLLDADPTALIYDVEKDSYEKLHDGKEFLSSDLISKIEISAAMIEKNPELNKCFNGGYPEVSIIWTEDGVRFKARLDYLKPKAIIDLKTFANFMNKPIDTAIYSAMAGNKYHIQAAFYLRAVEKAKELSDWNGCDVEFMKKVKGCKDHDFYFVFQQKGIAPLARGKKFPRAQMYQIGCAAIEQGIELFKHYTETYGTDPWVDIKPIDDFEDLLFPAYACEI